MCSFKFFIPGRKKILQDVSRFHKLSSFRRIYLCQNKSSHFVLTRSSWILLALHVISTLDLDFFFWKYCSLWRVRQDAQQCAWWVSDDTCVTFAWRSRTQPLVVACALHAAASSIGQYPGEATVSPDERFLTGDDKNVIFGGFPRVSLLRPHWKPSLGFYLPPNQ